jgi:hypothetical protein
LTQLDGPSTSTFLDLRVSRLWRRSSQLRRGLLQGSTKAAPAQASQGGVTPQGSSSAGSLMAVSAWAPQAAAAWAPSRRHRHRLLKQWRCGLLQGGVGVGSSSSGGVGSSSSGSVGYKAQGLDLGPRGLDLGSVIFFLKIDFSCRLVATDTITPIFGVGSWRLIPKMFDFLL